MIGQSAAGRSHCYSTLRAAFQTAFRQARQQHIYNTRTRWQAGGRFAFSKCYNPGGQHGFFRGFRFRGNSSARGPSSNSTSSVLDFAPTIKFTRPVPLLCTCIRGPKHCPQHKLHQPCPRTLARKQIRSFLFNTYLVNSCHKSHEACVFHGRGFKTALAGGNGGGQLRVAYNQARLARIRQRRIREYRAHYHRCIAQRLYRTTGPLHRHPPTRRAPFHLLQKCAVNDHSLCVDKRQQSPQISASPHYPHYLPPPSLQTPHSSESAQDPPSHSPFAAPLGNSASAAYSPYRPLYTHQHLAPGLRGGLHQFNRIPPIILPAFSHLSASRRALSHVKPDCSLTRCFSTTRVSEAPHLLLHALKATSLLKSSSALSYINLLFRISVSFIPLSLKRASWARKARLAAVAAGTSLPVPLIQTVVKVVCRGALALPFVLLAAVLVASLERTPLTGRWRLLMLSDAEEQDIVHRVLEVGDVVRLPATTPSLAPANAANGVASAPVLSLKAAEKRDWLAIMRAVLHEEDAPPGTLLGGKVLDPGVDWRARLVERVLDRLQAGIVDFGHDQQQGQQVFKAPSSTPLSPPAVKHPLRSSARSRFTDRKNAVLVVDRPESNAFSFGFYGSVDEPEPGVIIVFSGAIDEILGGRKLEDDVHPSAFDLDGRGQERGQGMAIHDHQQKTAEMLVDLSHEPHWLRSFFGSILPSGSGGARKQQQSRLQDVEQQRLAAETHLAAVRPEEEQALAVLLAHELAHLVLSHTIESYATTALLWPQLEKLGWDMIRVFIYPVTALLGPFVQEAVSATVKVGREESSGLLPALTSSCESRKMETEADIVALRLLASAGIDPRAALEFWTNRLERASASSQEHDSHEASAANQTDTPYLQRHSPSHSTPHGTTTTSGSSQSSSFIRSHPVDSERIAAIRKELARWTWRSDGRPGDLATASST